MALPSINFPLISPPESPLAALLKNALSSYDTVQNLKVNNIKNKYLEPNLQAVLAQHAAELEGQKIKNQYLPQSMQAEIGLNQARLAGENINNQYLPKLMEAKINKLNSAGQGQGSAPLSNVAKLQRDYQNAVNQYGEESPQAQELKGAIHRVITPTNVQKREAAEKGMQPYIGRINELLPDVKKYFGPLGHLKYAKDSAIGSPDVEKYKLFNSNLQLLKEEASILVNLPADQQARGELKKALNFNTWRLSPEQTVSSLQNFINTLQESGKASTKLGYKPNDNNQKIITGSNGKKYSIEELEKMSGGSQ